MAKELVNTKAKVWVPASDGMVPLRSPRHFERETVMGVERIVASTDEGWCELLVRLVAPGGTTFYCLYEQRDSEESVRTESEKMDLDSLHQIVAEFREFLESDPRHNFWAYNVEAEVQIVLDEHNHLIVYGRLDTAVGVLQELGFTKGSVELPTPHVHLYDQFGPEAEEAILARIRPAAQD